MNTRILVVFVLIVVLPIAIGLYWIVANGTEITLLGFAESLLFAAAVFTMSQTIRSAQKRRWRRNIKAEWEQDIADFQENLTGHVAARSIDCGQCGSSAFPILNSQNRYRCSKCGQDFAGAEHGLIDLDEFKRRNPDPSNMPYPTVN
jgi:DNA-directed RNA polymerase subunit RPC12/RpoP